MTITINVPLFLAILATGFSVIWLVFFARMNDGYYKPLNLTAVAIALIWIAYGVVK